MERNVIPLTVGGSIIKGDPHDTRFHTEPLPPPLTKGEAAMYQCGKLTEERKALVPFDTLYKGSPFTTYRQAKRFLDKHPEIRRRKRRKNRLDVHAGDWFACIANKAGRIPPTAEELGAYIDEIHEAAAEAAASRKAKREDRKRHK